jgi:hypothetical protein
MYILNAFLQTGTGIVQHPDHPKGAGNAGKERAHEKSQGPHDSPQGEFSPQGDHSQGQAEGAQALGALLRICSPAHERMAGFFIDPPEATPRAV